MVRVLARADVRMVRSCDMVVVHPWVSRMLVVRVRWARRAGRGDFERGV